LYPPFFGGIYRGFIERTTAPLAVLTTKLSPQEQTVDWRRSNVPPSKGTDVESTLKPARVRLRRSSKDEALKLTRESTQTKRGKKGLFIHFCDICNKVSKLS